MRRVRQNIQRTLDRVRKWHRVLQARNATADDLAAGVRSVNRHLANKRRVRKVLGAGHANRRDQIADRVEELKAARDRLLDKLDTVENKSDRAKRELGKARRDVQRLRDRREAILRAREARGDLSAHFSVAEFHCRDGTPVPTAAYPALKAWCAEYGEALRGRFGSVHINSGYRTSSYNASIGGASASVHIYDQHPGAVAGDFTCAAGNPSQWADFLEPKADGLGRYATFVHADNRNRIGWATSRWWG